MYLFTFLHPIHYFNIWSFDILASFHFPRTACLKQSCCTKILKIPSKNKFKHTTLGASFDLSKPKAKASRGGHSPRSRRKDIPLTKNVHTCIISILISTVNVNVFAITRATCNLVFEKIFSSIFISVITTFANYGNQEIN